MKKKTTATAKKSLVTASKKTSTAKNPVVKTAKKPVTLKPLMKKTPVVVEQPLEEEIAVVPAQTLKEEYFIATLKTAKKPATKPATASASNPDEVKTRKTAVRTGDIAEGDTDKGGRFEVLVGDVKIGEVAFCSILRMRDGAPSGYRRNWRGEDVNGKVLFTEGKRMNYVVSQLVNAWRMNGSAPEARRQNAATSPVEHVNETQGASV